MKKGFLDLNGLTKFLLKLKETFAPKDHKHSIDDVNNLQQSLNGKANSAHTHDATQVTQDPAHRFVTDEEKSLWNGLNPITTSGDGSAYTANINGLTSLKIGVKITIIPHVTSASMTPTLNLNNLGAKQIRMPVALNTSATSNGIITTWLLKNKPVTLEYDGMYWKTISMPRVPSQYLYGTVPIAQGGTGATTAEQARINIGAAKIMTSSITIAITGWELETQSGLYRVAISNSNVGTNDIIDINLDHLSILEGENCELKCTESYENGFHLYAKRIPAKQMTGTLVIIKGV